MQRAVSRNRIETIDLARGIALVAMAIYHFTWDLEFFGYAEPGLTAAGAWKYFARSIAASFLVLVGISLYLAHRNDIRWASFGKRPMVAGAALAISIVTYVAVPGGSSSSASCTRSRSPRSPGWRSCGCPGGRS